MQPKFFDMLKLLQTSNTLAEFCLQCPLCGIVLDDKTVEEFTLSIVEDVVLNSIKSNKNDVQFFPTDNEDSFLTFQSAQKYCMFIRQTDMLDSAVSTQVVQHILNCFYKIYVNQGAHIATERECAMSRDAVLALFFKSTETRKPGLLKTLKTADKRNILYLIADYSNISEYLHLMKDFVDGKLLPKISIDENDDDISYNVLRQTFGHTIRSLISCGVDPYEKADNGNSFADLILQENLSKLIQENYDGYLETKEDQAKEQAV